MELFYEESQSLESQGVCLPVICQALLRFADIIRFADIRSSTKEVCTLSRELSPVSSDDKL